MHSLVIAATEPDAPMQEEREKGGHVTCRNDLHNLCVANRDGHKTVEVLTLHGVQGHTIKSQLQTSKII